MGVVPSTVESTPRSKGDYLPRVARNSVQTAVYVRDETYNEEFTEFRIIIFSMGDTFTHKSLIEEWQFVEREVPYDSLTEQEQERVWMALLANEE